jgi:hypothetical protein
VKTDPIVLEDVKEGDTHPICIWVMKDPAGSIEDLTSPAKTVTLYYFDNFSGGPGGPTLWKKVLTKSATPTDGAVSYTASLAEPYYPTALIALGGGRRELRGWLRFIDTSASPPVDVWVEDALRVFASQKLSEPA